MDGSPVGLQFWGFPYTLPHLTGNSCLSVAQAHANNIQEITYDPQCRGISVENDVTTGE